MSHKKSCKCARCAAIESGLTPEEATAEMHRWEAEMMEKYGWYIHFLPDGSHTHGLQESFNHPDLEIKFFLNPNTAGFVFSNCIDKIKEGTIFNDGDVVEHIISGYSVKLINALESERSVIRIILPDADGNLIADRMAKGYAGQYE